MAGCYERRNELSGYIKDWEFLGWLSDCFSRRTSATRSGLLSLLRRSGLDLTFSSFMHYLATNIKLHRQW
jgi:hypothetical protein